MPSRAAPVGLIDTGAILALLDRDDAGHESCVAAYNANRLPWLTSEAVLTEVLHLVQRNVQRDVRRNVRHDRGVWQLLRSGAIRMVPIANEELPHIQTLMRDFSDRPMDFADATLVHLAARERLSRIFTIDHNDFEIYRLPGGKKFTILPSRWRT